MSYALPSCAARARLRKFSIVPLLSVCAAVAWPVLPIVGQWSGIGDAMAQQLEPDAKKNGAQPVAAQAKPEQAKSMNIQQIKSPGGIDAWLVESHNVPLFALRFAFEGGNAQDPVGKEGLANFMTAMMDEGAGPLDAGAFQERVEDIAMRMGFEDGRDQFYGSFETLTINRDKAIELLHHAVKSPRFEESAVDRIKQQLLAGLMFASRDPNKVASKAWSAAAFAGHPYGRPTEGTAQSLGAITGPDLKEYHAKVFARDTLKVVAVGDIDAKTLGALLDKVFGDLPAATRISAVPDVTLRKGGALQVIEMPVPQSVATFGSAAMLRKDPDFMAAFVVNQILGGGGFASRLMEEVREKRGLAYSVYSYISPMTHSSIFGGGVATKNEEMGKSLDVIKAELRRMATDGPSAVELDNAQKYLTGSYALRFDTNSKIATQLLGILVEDLGVEYIDKRNAQINAVTLADAKRVASKLLNVDDLIVTIVGKPDGFVTVTQKAAPRG